MFLWHEPLALGIGRRPQLSETGRIHLAQVSAASAKDEAAKRGEDAEKGDAVLFVSLRCPLFCSLLLLLQELLWVVFLAHVRRAVGVHESAHI